MLVSNTERVGLNNWLQKAWQAALKSRQTKAFNGYSGSLVLKAARARPGVQYLVFEISYSNPVVPVKVQLGQG